jgi:DNA-binding NtrC family response regulator
MASRQDDLTHAVPTEGRRPESWIEDAIARDPVLGRLLPQLRRHAAGDAPVLITGEPGSGRELAARAIHNLSARSAHPFVLVDCAGLSDSMMEPELLGVVDPATGNIHKPGVFHQAGAGTVQLAEVGELPPRLQEALLRVLERHEIVPLNADSATPVSARVLATSSVDLRTRVPAGLFREDLHARLANDVLALPPLRERGDDIAALARRILEQCCAHLPQAARDLSPEAQAVLRSYAWPGNLRELREVIEEAAVRARGERIGVEHLPERVRGEAQQRGGPLPSLRDVEMRYIERVLQEARGNQRRASRILGISRWSLSRRLRKYGMHARGDE